ncbi:hypothetical protein [Sphingomonas sp. PB4P5]|uniref:hypothetical protein n=1 Tax=Parasphingomonas puruogangriensis TaxID=3096155 RepID=UPI002FCA1C47
MVDYKTNLECWGAFVHLRASLDQLSERRRWRMALPCYDGGETAILEVKMFAVLLLLASQTVVDQDRKEFEEFWSEQIKSPAEPMPPKELAWRYYEWAQAQFSLGYCSQYVPADAAERMRTFPNEAELLETELGRSLVDGSRNSFRHGMTFRAEVRPNAALCLKELGERGVALEAATRDAP